MIKVLVVDDSASVRNILKIGLSKHPLIEVLDTAPDVYVARDKIVLHKPDVITLDIEMPKMDGLEFLRRLMPQHPLPVVMVSSMTAPGARATLDALDAGAVDFVLKPSTSFGVGLEEMMQELIEKIIMASKVKINKVSKKIVKRTSMRKASNILSDTTDKVIAIGASTGGTIAIRQIVTEFPANMPGTVIVQHMPPKFTKLYADKLNDVSAVEVKEAQTGDRIQAGRVLIAPGAYHMEVIRSGGEYRVRCREGEKVNGHCPSVEVLFNSISKNVGSNAVGLMLTGMGKDGATAMLNMRNAGARTFAQDEASSVVFGMPNEAYKCGGAERLVPLDNITPSLINLLKKI